MVKKDFSGALVSFLLLYITRHVLVWFALMYRWSYLEEGGYGEVSVPSRRSNFARTEMLKHPKELCCVVSGRGVLSQGSRQKPGHAQSVS